MNLYHLASVVWTVASGLAIFGVGLDIAIQLSRIADALTKLKEPDNEP